MYSFPKGAENSDSSVGGLSPVSSALAVLPLVQIKLKPHLPNPEKQAHLKSTWYLTCSCQLFHLTTTLKSLTATEKAFKQFNYYLLHCKLTFALRQCFCSVYKEEYVAIGLLPINFL